MKYRVCMLAGLAVAAAFGQRSAEQVIEKYMQAIGGRAAFEKVTTRVMKGTVEIPDDQTTGTAEIYAKAPDRYRSTFDFPGYGTVERVLDGEKGWDKNPESGVSVMSRTDLTVNRRDHDFYRETHWKDLYPKMAAPAAEKLDGRAVYMIEAAPAEGSAEKLYFDAESGLLVKQDYERVTLEDGIVQYEAFYRDYREVDGIKFPFTIEQRAPDNTMIFKFTEIRNNVPIADGKFAKPEKQH
jgi:zinc protease